MVILDRPYVSKFLEETILEMNLPVLENQSIDEFNLDEDINFLEDKDFIARVKNDIENNKRVLLYSNSENPINWISKNLSFTDLAQKIDVFKDKVKFRDLLKYYYPDFFYQEVSFAELEQLDISEFKKPFIIKPSIGFFSIGVYKVNSDLEWERAIKELKQEVKEMADKYPIEVINTTKFIIEENLEGEEFAVDIYYNDLGEPVILNILKHSFSSEEDVSDRVYMTSKEIIEEYHDLFLDFLSKMGQLIELRNFPMHVELRVDKSGNINPIEVNPMRFAGWCTTDLAYYAYGINVYEYLFGQKKPNWEEILKDKVEKIYSIIVADLPKDIEASEIKGVNYDKFISYFEKVLEVRRIDYLKYNVFAFLFAESSYENHGELDEILRSDLREYLKLKS